jgi:hypothetical protein
MFVYQVEANEIVKELILLSFTWIKGTVWVVINNYCRSR